MSAASELRERAERITPNGCQTLSKRAYPVPMPHAVWGVGARIWTDDGRDMIDWVCSLATVTLGHGRPEVNTAIARQLSNGGTFALPHIHEVIVSERLCALMGYEQVRWCSTGSEATEAAVRVARIATGRDLILTQGYHSWFSTFTAAREHRPGVPSALASVMHEFGHLGQITPEVAAVIVEPAPLGREALVALLEAAHEVGALVIFDEVVSGLRVAVRGAQEFYDVKPDLSIYGKALSNGTFPVAALLGSREVMQHAWPASGTYSGHPVGLAAVDAVLDIYEREPVIARLHGAGQALIDGINALGGPVKAGGHPSRPILSFVDDEASRRFHTAVLERGILMHPAGNNASAAHTDKDITQTVEACQEVMKA